LLKIIALIFLSGEEYKYDAVSLEHHYSNNNENINYAYALNSLLHAENRCNTNIREIIDANKSDTSGNALTAMTQQKIRHNTKCFRCNGNYPPQQCKCKDKRCTYCQNIGHSEVKCRSYRCNVLHNQKYYKHKFSSANLP
jgi:hypothetical protein